MLVLSWGCLAGQAVCVGFLCTKSMREKYQFTSWRLPKGARFVVIRSAKDGLKLMVKVRLSSLHWRVAWCSTA